MGHKYGSRTTLAWFTSRIYRLKNKVCYSFFQAFKASL